MIIIDPRKGGEKNGNAPKEIADIINRLGGKAVLDTLDYADAAFEGNGPHGSILIGIERKTLPDMLHCIEDHRLSGHQMIGMRQMYAVNVVMLEGFWRPHSDDGWLMQGFEAGTTWGYYGGRGARKTLYSKLYRYLISLRLSHSVILDTTRDIFQTAYHIYEWFNYFQKSWDQHTSLREIQRVTIPTLLFKPSLTRRWAHDLDDVGHKISDLAERHFRTPIRLANADELEWMKLPGIGAPTAQKIVRQIWGIR